MKNKLKKIYNPKIFIVLLIPLVVATVIINVQVSALGAELSQYKKRQNELSYEVEELENNLIVLTSITDKLEESENLGLGEPSQVYYLKPGETFASR